MERKIIMRNILASLLLQIATIISGLVVPKTIIRCFGSEVNGLVSSLNQFLNYITLLEGGLGSVILAALYKPLSQGDNSKVNGILRASSYFFKKIAFIYVIYVFILGIIYPIFIKTPFDIPYVFALTMVLAINLFIQYFFSITYKLLLIADRKSHVVSVISSVVTFLNILIVIVGSKHFEDILIVRFLSALLIFIIPIGYNYYVNKFYKLNKNVLPDANALKHRWDGFGINIAYFIHSNTDIAIITIALSLVDVSVYSVYAMIVFALKNLVSAISNAIVPSFGKALMEEGNEQIRRKFDLYEYGVVFLTTLFFACGMILISPFVSVYTIDILDANYQQPLLGVMFVLAEMIYCLRDPYINVAYTAGHFRQISRYAYMEAIVNIIISLVLVNRCGLVGVVTGTGISMFIRMVVQAIYLKRNILYRSIRMLLKMIAYVFSIIICSLLIFHKMVSIRLDNYMEWFICGMNVFCVVVFLSLVFSRLFYKTQFLELIGNRIQKVMKKEKAYNSK